MAKSLIFFAYFTWLLPPPATQVAPAAVKSIRGGVESACCLILAAQVILLLAFCYQFYVTFGDERATRFLSLEEDDFCKPVTVSTTDKFGLDNDGSVFIRAPEKTPTRMSPCCFKITREGCGCSCLCVGQDFHKCDVRA